MEAGGIQIHSIEEMPKMIDEVHQRPKKQWWMDLRTIARLMAQPVEPAQPEEQ
jgi:6-phosphofructokinase 1